MEFSPKRETEELKAKANPELANAPNQADASQAPRRQAVKRAHAESYLLISLVAFAGSVIATRLFLQLTGYPQLGNAVLHIAHALWGGLLLLAGVLLPLLLANRWARVASAALSGTGVGLFVDEIGKFITQQNDYFYPAAAPLIYAFFLLMVLLFLFMRRPDPNDPRAELYQALSDLDELIDNNLDAHELQALLNRLETASQAEQSHVAGLAQAIQGYLKTTPLPLVPVKPGLWMRFNVGLEAQGRKLGRDRHRSLILVSLLLMSLEVLFTLALIFYLALEPSAYGSRLVKLIVTEAEIQNVSAGFWFDLRILLEGAAGLIYVVAIVLLRRGQEARAAQTAILGLLLSLTGVRLLSFYLDQFSAVLAALVQFAILMVILAYQYWYLEEEDEYGKP